MDKGPPYEEEEEHPTIHLDGLDYGEEGEVFFDSRVVKTVRNLKRIK